MGHRQKENAMRQDRVAVLEADAGEAQLWVSARLWAAVADILALGTQSALSALRAAHLHHPKLVFISMVPDS